MSLPLDEALRTARRALMVQEVVYLAGWRLTRRPTAARKALAETRRMQALNYWKTRQARRRLGQLLLDHRAQQGVPRG